jgi:hypothetical protein
MFTQNTHEVDPFDSTMVQGNLLVIPVCKQNLREYQPVEEPSISVSQARTRKSGCSVTHTYIYILTEGGFGGCGDGFPPGIATLQFKAG